MRAAPPSGSALSTDAGVLPLLLIVLALGAAAVSLLGPLGLGSITYHVSAGAAEQLRGGDVAGLLLVGPVSLVAAWSLACGRPGAAAVALAPASYGLYMYTQLAITGDLARYGGNSERWFGLFWALIVICLAVLVLAGRRLARGPVPALRWHLEQAVGCYLMLVAVFLTLGLHLPGLVDAWRASPTSAEYLADPVAFWAVKVMDLAYVVPVVVTVGVGLLRGATWARLLLAPVTGWCALLATSVAGMGITMLVTSAPGASTGLAVGFTVAAAVAVGLAVAAYTPLLSASSAAASSEPPTPRLPGTTMEESSMRSTSHEVEAVEIHLEELGQRSWLKAAANTLLGNLASAQFRFVARPADGSRPAGQDAGISEDALPVLVGATFPVMRWDDLDDRSAPDSWLETAESRLDELDTQLLGTGWVTSDQQGPHWWSRRYHRRRPMSQSG